ncbi:hypothetical protein [Serratia marcescens]|uniref:hypothetical protein n=1 Tax=Serratia marcescens TaxID=615 RepID=UPI0029D9297B|nr:hypothetical protein [Serratia marcescens]MDX7546931.1 hypothetical protein [Serratia marcescens]MDX7567559.1 hypothetical protein [Serratia marcescens]
MKKQVDLSQYEEIKTICRINPDREVNELLDKKFWHIISIGSGIEPETGEAIQSVCLGRLRP